MPKSSAKPLLAQTFELVGAQLDLERSEVLPQVLERERAGDRQRRGRALQEPSERNLLRRGAVSVGNLGQLRAPHTAEREEGDEHDPFGGAVVDHLVVRALDEAVPVLNRSDRHDVAGLLDLVDTDLGEADAPDLAAVAVLLDRAEAVVERGLGIDPVQVVESDRLRPQPPQALFDLSSEHLGAAVSSSPSVIGRPPRTTLFPYTPLVQCS